MDAATLENLFISYLLPFGLKVLTVIVIWLAGNMGVNIVSKMLRRLLSLRHLEPTLIHYAVSASQVTLRILLIMVILGICGVPTTSFAALIGAVGVAIGVAWSGLLSNFAAGIFIIILRPFRVGDYVNAAGQTGTITEIGLFITVMTTDNNLRTIVGNNKLFSDIITNYSANPIRRVDLRCQIAYGVDPAEAITRLSEQIKRIPNVLDNPALNISIQEFNPIGTLLAVRLYSSTRNFSQVTNDTNMAIAQTCATAGWPAPATYQVAVSPAQP